MTKPEAHDCVMSGRSDARDVSLDSDLAIDPVEYSRIMRRIGVADDESVTQVSAFNSSI
jgi:hypothetical protein